MQIRQKSRRAVAPIIATLLMVAISVVGGILIFVFAQDFFTTSNVSAPRIESIEIFGYNATDTTDLSTHADISIASMSTATQKLADSDAFAVFIRNRGSGPVVIEDVKVYGTSLTFSTSTAAVSGTIPPDSGWLLTKGTGTPAGKGTQIIEAGEELTVVIAYDSVINGEVKVGRPIPVVIKTGSGAIFTKQITNGLSAG